MFNKLNFRHLLNIIGGLLILEGLFMLVPTVTSALYHESDSLMFFCVALVTTLCGVLFRKIPAHSTRLGKRDGFLLTGSVWIFFSLFGMLPFIFCSTPVGLSSAFFEAMSGFTTTGATSLDFPVSTMSHGMIIWMALMQWLGGMGIIIFTLAVVPALNTSGGMLMFNAEATGITHDKIRPRISQTAMTLWGTYFLLTVILFFLLWAGPMDVFDSICHAFGTISTGGFSTKAGSISEYNSTYILIVVCVFMFVSGMNYSMLYQMCVGRWRAFSKNDVVKVYIGAVIVFTILFAIGRIVRGEASTWQQVGLYPLFQVVSSITSTGYLAPGFFMWEPFVLALTFLMMFSGGCAGSTSGGAKIDRLIYLKRFLSNELIHCIHSNAILSVKMNGKIVNRDLVMKTIAFLSFFILLIVGGGTLMSFMGLKPVDSFFSAFSCICNTGFGASLTGYGEDFTAIPDAAKWVLSFLMLTGRLEIYTILVLFSPSFWK